MQIESFLSYKYSEVWEITEFRDGCIYKTKPTGFDIETINSDKLDLKKYTISSLSTKRIEPDFVTINLICLT